MTPQDNGFARILDWLLVVSIPIWLVLTSVRLLMTETYVQIAYSVPGFPADVYGFSMDDRRAYAPFAVRYLLNDAGSDYLGRLTFPDGSPMYNARELRHMADVKTVARATFNFHTAFTATLLLVGVYLGWRPATRPTLRRAMARGGWVTLSGIALLVILVALYWDFFFTAFHQLFFESGTWRFEYSDTLIRLFPEFFWFNAALTIGGLTATGALLLILIAWVWGRRAKKVHTP